MIIEAFAKVNLTLEVFGKRADGFHALRSVVLPISLADTLAFTPADSFSTDTGYPDDLILKAVHVLAQQQPTIAHQQAYAIRVTKRIPAGGGLGGGSADAAATLLALNELWQLGKKPEELALLGAQVGSDVPALVLATHYRTPVLMEGRGEVVTPLGVHARLHLVLANPGVLCSTAAVYGKCTAREDDGGVGLDAMRTALSANNVSQIASLMNNDLQDPAIEVCPAIGRVLEAMREARTIGAMMSGSGSTVFGLVSDEVVGEKVVALLNAKGIRAWSISSL